MKSFFTGKILIPLAVILVLAIGGIILSVASSSSGTPFGNVTGVLLNPFQKAVDFITDSAGGFFGVFYENDSLKNEIERLRSQMLEMEESIRESDKLREENELFRDLYGIAQQHEDFKFEKAEIIARGNVNWSKVFTIDKGTLDGITLHNAVITPEGFIGYVSEVGSTWAEVTSVIDTEMQAGAMIERTRDVGVVEGDFELMKQGRLKMVYLRKDAELSVDDIVITSGIGGLFPKGLVLGKIKKIGTEVHGISKYAEIEPIIDVDEVTSVIIITAFDVND